MSTSLEKIRFGESVWKLVTKPLPTDDEINTRKLKAFLKMEASAADNIDACVVNNR